MAIDIQRINRYDDPRFSPQVLWQHGAFLVDDRPYEVEIVGQETAVVRGPDSAVFPELMEHFRFFAEHIYRFIDESGRLIREYRPVALFSVKLTEIQPSQFYVDIDKIAAVKNFIGRAEDIVIPLIKTQSGYISLDGHTRLALAVEWGFNYVQGFFTQAGDYIVDFAREAQKRNVWSPFDLQAIPHEKYEVLWNQFCDEFFERKSKI